MRHGKPTFELKGKVRSREIGEIISHYDASGITGKPPEESKLKALACNTAVCSDLTRSIESAKILGFEHIHLSDPIFREVATPHFKGGSFVLPVSAWGVILRCLSIFGFSRNGESLSIAKKRAKEAASVLIDIAHIHKMVLLVGHGFMNYFIAKELLSRNWVGPSKPGSGYWEYGIYQYNATGNSHVFVNE